MTLIAKPFTFVPGTEADADEVNANFDALYNDYNGNITNANLAANAGISLSKVSMGGAELGPIARSTELPCISVTVTGDIDRRWAVYSDGYMIFKGIGGLASGGLMDGYSCQQEGRKSPHIRLGRDAPPVANFSTLGGFVARYIKAQYSYGDGVTNFAGITLIAGGGSDASTIDIGPGENDPADLSIKRESSTMLAIKNGFADDDEYRDLHLRAITCGTPITKANINDGVVRKNIVIPVVNGTIADGATYTVTCPVHRAGTITGIKASIGTAIVGGTSTVAITKNGTTTLLSTGTVDPTTFTANTATTLTLTATSSDLICAAGDIIKIVHTAGTQGTDGVGESISIEYATTDF